MQEYYDLTAWVYKRHWDKVLQKIDSSAQNDGIGQTDMVAISKSISAAQDDVVMFISTNYDIWKCVLLLRRSFFLPDIT
jgi:hypothetical protein